ncbi:hypothetical protein Fmac_026834 [Flemingia macrophylla]|uniref:Sodium/calcium exchanger membrane region domain-containing protein n=1 Tax=Flemingia macrophylla TaxID=520843 RepID=A0ABD1LFZ4_9FABA
MLELLGLDAPTADDTFEGEVTCIDKWMLRDPNPNFRLPSKFVSGAKRKIAVDELGGVRHHDNVFGERNQRVCTFTKVGDNFIVTILPCKPCNNAPDVFTSLTALGTGHFCTSLSVILSTGTFVSTFVVGFVAIYLTPLVNNVFFYLTIAFFLFYICLAYDVCPHKNVESSKTILLTEGLFLLNHLLRIPDSGNAFAVKNACTVENTCVALQALTSTKDNARAAVVLRNLAAFSRV